MGGRVRFRLADSIWTSCEASTEPAASAFMLAPESVAPPPQAASTAAKGAQSIIRVGGAKAQLFNMSVSHSWCERTRSARAGGGAMQKMRVDRRSRYGAERVVRQELAADAPLPREGTQDLQWLALDIGVGWNRLRANDL